MKNQIPMNNPIPNNQFQNNNQIPNNNQISNNNQFHNNFLTSNQSNAVYPNNSNLMSNNMNNEVPCNSNMNNNFQMNLNQTSPQIINNPMNNLNSNINLCGNNFNGNLIQNNNLNSNYANNNFNNEWIKNMNNKSKINNSQNNQNNNIEKPMNRDEILKILKKARFKLSDFGLSKLKPNDSNRNEEANRCGSPLYMSPELFLMETSLMTVEDQKVDIWALGVLAYEMFYGRRPFEAGSIDQLSRMYAKGKYYLCSEELNKVENNIIIKKIYKTISKEFVEFLNLCLQKNPKERATAVELTKTDFYNRD
jgi:hypothetical protein